MATKTRTWTIGTDTVEYREVEGGAVMLINGSEEYRQDEDMEEGVKATDPATVKGNRADCLDLAKGHVADMAEEMAEAAEMAADELAEAAA